MFNADSCEPGHDLRGERERSVRFPELLARQPCHRLSGFATLARQMADFCLQTRHHEL